MLVRSSFCRKTNTPARHPTLQQRLQRILLMHPHLSARWSILHSRSKTKFHKWGLACWIESEVWTSAEHKESIVSRAGFRSATLMIPNQVSSRKIASGSAQNFTLTSEFWTTLSEGHTATQTCDRTIRNHRTALLATGQLLHWVCPKHRGYRNQHRYIQHQSPRCCLSHFCNFRLSVCTSAPKNYF